MADDVKNSADNAEEDYLTLKFDDGTELECEIIGVFDVGDKDYIALLPEGDGEDIYLYEYVEYEDDSFELLDIEDDAEFDRVAAEFDKLILETEEE